MGLIHAAAEAVRANELEPIQALDALSTSTLELGAGPERGSAGS